jgi:NAD(P)-dependent dehydrogenase (short-subunit alcohol dehydrogenase family)
VRDFAGRVAVVTGAASGIGRALAERFAAEKMKIVLADVEEAPLREAAAALAKHGTETLAVPTDVSRAADVDALARRTLDAFGAVHVVCNNAGVFTAGLSWEAPVADWEWVFGVNLMGVVHGVRTFVPILLAQGTEAHVVNTASMAAVTTMPWVSIYHASKHAVLALSECLHHELTLRGAQVKVSVLCPEAVATRIDDSERVRPERHAAAPPPSAEREMVRSAITASIRAGVPPAEIAERVVGAIREERFYVLSGGDWQRMCETRCEDVRTGRNPTFVPPGST